MKKLQQWRPRSTSIAEKEAARTTVTRYLRNVDVFKDLTSEEIEALFDGVMLSKCSPGTVFFAPDHSSELLFILKEGNVELYRLTPGGKRLVTRRIGPGAIFGEMGLLGQSLQGCFAEATENSLVCIATRDDVLRLLQRRPDVALRLLEMMGNRLKSLEERLEQAVFSPVQARLASFLLSNMDDRQVVSGYTQEEIGNVVGALRQTVSETLGQLQNDGIVAVAHKKITVREVEALEQIADSPDN
ncbi:MAG: Crp/Fnr family transcriptional regulator [Chloroflexi bacterium]|nr:Crp/Fnr family transcriptional regulator [Chloroflexota bacterium]